MVVLKISFLEFISFKQKSVFALWFELEKFKTLLMAHETYTTITGFEGS